MLDATFHNTLDRFDWTAFKRWFFNRQLLIIIASLFLAFFFGLVASTGEVFFAAIIFGLFVGSFAFIYPTMTVWLILIAGLFVAGVVTIWATGIGSKAVWGVSLLGFLLLGCVFLALLSASNRNREAPLFIWLALVFMGYCLINGILQSSLYELFSGYKRYFQVASLCFAFTWLTFSEKAIKHWKVLFLVLAVVQLPWSLYQLFLLVPMREAFQFAYPGLVPIDVVAGTFGASKYGGGANAEMATFLIIVIAFSIARWKEQVNSKRDLCAVIALSFIPLFLGETKIVVVFLPLVFGVLFFRELRSNPVWALLSMLIGGMATFALAYVYLQIMELGSFTEMYERTIEYNLQGMGYGGLYLNRLTAVSFWFENQGAHKPLAFFFGEGIGTAHDVTGGAIAQQFPGYGIGLTALSTLLWEQGLLGTLLFFLVLGLAWLSAGKLRSESKMPEVRADALAIQAALSMFLVYPIYRVTMLESLPFQVVVWSVLGYLAWLCKRHRLAGRN